MLLGRRNRAVSVGIIYVLLLSSTSAGTASGGGDLHAVSPEEADSLPSPSVDPLFTSLPVERRTRQVCSGDALFLAGWYRGERVYGQDVLKKRGWPDRVVLNRRSSALRRFWTAEVRGKAKEFYRASDEYVLIGEDVKRLSKAMLFAGRRMKERYQRWLWLEQILTFGGAGAAKVAEGTKAGIGISRVSLGPGLIISVAVGLPAMLGSKIEKDIEELGTKLLVLAETVRLGDRLIRVYTELESGDGRKFLRERYVLRTGKLGVDLYRCYWPLEGSQ